MRLLSAPADPLPVMSRAGRQARDPATPEPGIDRARAIVESDRGRETALLIARHHRITRGGCR